jgi:NADPH-dependent F420 reductase
MKTKQAVAVIGAAGKMGSAIAKSISTGNYRILLHSTDPNKIETVMNDIKNEYPSADVDVVNDILDACWEADIIIAAVPYIAEKEVTDSIRKVTNQKVVISVSNPINDSSTGLVTMQNTSAAEELQKLLPNAKVVKAFNTTFDFKNPVINGQQMDCFIAGNDENALEVVYDLVKTSGFNPVIAGDITASRTLESMQFLLTQLSMQKNYQWVAGWKILHN